MGRYWLDADVLIQAKNTLYDFNIAPPFWNFLDQQAKLSKICSSMKIYEEILRYEDKQDPLSKWVKQRKNSGMFAIPNKEVQEKFREIADHIEGKYIKPGKAAEFLKGGDGWIIAHAKIDGGIVVSYENRVDSSSLTPKIPNICHDFGVGCINLPAMLTKLKFKFA